MKTKKACSMTLLLVLLCFLPGLIQGQTFDDWEGRPGISIEHEFENGIEISWRYKHYLDDNMSHYKKSGVGLKVDYDYNLTTWLEPGIDYQYKRNGKEDRHDIRYSAKIVPVLKSDFELEYSLKLQQVIASRISPEYFVRNKVELAYEAIRSLSLFVFTENYQMVNGGFFFDTQKTGLGVEYAMSKTNNIEFKIDMKNKSSHQDVGRLTLNYTYIIP